MTTPDIKKFEYVAGYVSLDIHPWDPIVKPEYLLYRRGDPESFASQLPIQDWRESSINGLRDQRTNARVAARKNEAVSDEFGRTVILPAIVEICERTLQSGLTVPFLRLMAEPDFLQYEGTAVLHEVELAQGATVILNNALWYWLSHPLEHNEATDVTTFITITDADHEVIVYHPDEDNPKHDFYSILNDSVEDYDFEELVDMNREQSAI